MLLIFVMPGRCAKALNGPSGLGGRPAKSARNDCWRHKAPFGLLRGFLDSFKFLQNVGCAARWNS